MTANLLPGVNQGLAWTITVTSKIDLVGPRNRGFAPGINEFSSYAGVSAGGFLSGLFGSIYRLRVVPFLFVLSVIFVVGGMWLAAPGIVLVSVTTDLLWWLAGALVMGLGMALLYPTLLTVVSDVAAPQWRATSLGVYRLWRDSGYAFGR